MTSRTTSMSLAWVGVLLIVAAGCGRRVQNDAGDDAPPGVLSLEPETLEFEFHELDRRQERTIRMENTGPGPLEVRSIEIMEGGEDSTKEFVPSVANWSVNLPLEIEPGEPKVERIRLAYEPTNTTADSAELVFETDTSESARKVQVETGAPEPHVDVPRGLFFPPVPGGSQKGLEAEIWSRGAAPLTVDDLSIPDSEVFQVTVPPPDGTEGEQTDPSDEQDPGEALPETVAPREPLVVHVWLTPETDASHEAELVVSSNDPENPRATIPLSAPEPE